MRLQAHTLHRSACARTHPEQVARLCHSQGGEQREPLGREAHRTRWCSILRTLSCPSACCLRAHTAGRAALQRTRPRPEVLGSSSVKSGAELLSRTSEAACLSLLAAGTHRQAFWLGNRQAGTVRCCRHPGLHSCLACSSCIWRWQVSTARSGLLVCSLSVCSLLHVSRLSTVSKLAEPKPQSLVGEKPARLMAAPVEQVRSQHQ